MNQRLYAILSRSLLIGYGIISSIGVLAITGWIGLFSLSVERNERAPIIVPNAATCRFSPESRYAVISIQLTDFLRHTYEWRIYDPARHILLPHDPQIQQLMATSPMDFYWIAPDQLLIAYQWEYDPQTKKKRPTTGYIVNIPTHAVTDFTRLPLLAKQQITNAALQIHDYDDQFNDRAVSPSRTYTFWMFGHGPPSIQWKQLNSNAPGAILNQLFPAGDAQPCNSTGWTHTEEGYYFIDQVSLPFAPPQAFRILLTHPQRSIWPWAIRIGSILLASIIGWILWKLPRWLFRRNKWGKKQS